MLAQQLPPHQTPHDRTLLRERHSIQLPWSRLSSGSSGNGLGGSSSDHGPSGGGGSGIRVPFHSRDLAMVPTLLDPVLAAASSDGARVHPQIVPQYAVLGEVVATGGRRGICEPIAAGASAGGGCGGLVLFNTNTPSTTLICGVQGVGKSHTLNTILEAALIRHKGCGHLVEPMTPLILHYDTVSDFKCMPCESAHLGTLRDGIGGKKSGTLAPKVTVLVSPTNLRSMEEAYRGIPNVTVYPLLLSEKDLTVKRVHNLMCVDESSVKPLYIQVIEQELRNINARHDRFTFKAFEAAMSKHELNAAQKMMLNLRIMLIKSCIKEEVAKSGAADLKRRATQTPPLAQIFAVKGGVVIVDLSDPYIDRVSACSLFDIVVGMFCAGGDKGKDGGGAGKIVVLDEAHKYLAQKNEGSVPLIETLTTLIAQQRHVGLRLLISTQDPTGVPLRILELTSTFILHAFNSPSWFDHLKAHIRFNLKGGSAQGGEEKDAPGGVFDVILALPLGVAVIVSPRGLGVVEARVSGVSTTSGVGAAGNGGDVAGPSGGVSASGSADAGGGIAGTSIREVAVNGHLVRYGAAPGGGGGGAKTTAVTANDVVRRIERMGGDYWIVSVRERITRDGGRS
ncbi:hypothetical protein HK101_002869, partial [Irineochytrium annulatum]